ncbi:hypothetical protein [Gordonia caeni]|uniref:ImmA/IrrE family metallo-endopeptidase n=1 Tax=Gordonia caeni TaxID=1007097 RepID=A0ABP7PBW9_9ACTN
MKRWHPWHWLRDHYPHVSVEHTPLPPGRRGAAHGDLIWLHDRLTQAERRTTLTHELIHFERRGREHPHPAVEEQIVEAETARRMIPLRQLCDAFAWLRHPDAGALAEHLWVDQALVHARMENLDPLEVAQIEHACDGDWSWSVPHGESAC